MKYISRLFLGLATALLVAACGGGGGGGSVNPTLPADAVTITTTNADSIANSAVSTLTTLGSITGAETQTLPSMMDVINSITDRVFSRDRRTYSVATGLTGSEPCYNGNGTISYSYTETATSESGSATFNSCDLGGGVIVNGSLSYSSTWNITTYAYTDSGNGSLTVSGSSFSFTLAMNYSETGNYNSGEYSMTVSYSVSGIPGGGFLVTTTVPITGNYIYGYVYPGGQIMVQGAGGTRLRITVTATNIATVEFDDGSGVFVTRPSTIYIYVY